MIFKYDTVDGVSVPTLTNDRQLTRMAILRYFEEARAPTPLADAVSTGVAGTEDGEAGGGRASEPSSLAKATALPKKRSVR